MRPLSEDATRLLKALFGAAWHHSGETQARLYLAQVAALREPRAVVALLSLVAHQGHLLEAAAETIDSLLDGIIPSELAWLDQHARAFAFEAAFDQRIEHWDRLTPPEVTSIARRIPTHTSALGMLTCHHNGRVRETAVMELADSRNGREIPFLTLRANDWVLPVAEAASILLDGRLVSANRAHVLDALPFIVRMTGGSRRDHQPFVEATRAVIASDHGTEALQRVGGFSPQVRRFVLQTVWQDAPGVANPALAAAMRSSNVACRSMAVQWLAALTNDVAGSVPLLDELSRDSASSIRRDALSVLIDRSPERRDALATHALLDDAVSVRSFARFVVRRYAVPLEPRAFYLLELRNDRPRRLPAAIDGVGETGVSADAELLAPLMTTAAPRVRQAALQAIARLDPARSVTLAMAALRSDQALQSAAIRVLGMHPHLTDFRAVAAACTPSNEVTTRRISRLFTKAPRWEVPTLLLELLGETNTTHRPEIIARLNAWLIGFSRKQVPPAPGQLARLRAQLEAHPDLPETLRRELEFAIASCTPEAET